MADSRPPAYGFENPCPNEWHEDYDPRGVERESIRAYLTCPECPQARHYEIARLARLGAFFTYYETVTYYETGRKDEPCG